MIIILFDRINQQYQALSKGQKKIADAMLKDPKQFIELSTHDLEQQVGASAATIVRFARVLGYSGMEEMRVYLAQQVEYNSHAVDLVIGPDDTAETLEDKVIQLYRESTQGIRETLSIQAIDEACQLLANAQRVYLLGVGTSGLVAYDLYHRLNRYGKTTFYETDTHMNLEFSMQSTPKDVIVCFSYSGLTKEVIVGAEAARKRHTPVISVLSDPDSPLARVTDVALYIPHTEHLVRLAALSSRVHSMLVADILFSGTMKAKMPKLQNLIVESNKLTSKLKA
ncbi:MurR/RpiR family transcriptional regulator [Lacticaseibacillus daqingensis]|uniref:MurR/RpiR family transcriptional regulator n=1 Tax=Lacticaseibacillus daqingensis TaxID=2486014 RepID=UPI000F793199|nr:MurR/RpiR family transcriptional regulator [Lacticaseibacillus daqingensis]